MKIAVLHNYLTTFGGAERVLLNQIALLKARKHFVKLYTYAYNPQIGYDLGDIKVNIIKHKKIWLPLFRRTVNDYLRTFACPHIEDAEVILCHNYPTNIAATNVKEKYGLPIIWYCHHPSYDLYPYLRPPLSNNLRISLPSLLGTFIKRKDRLAARTIDVVLANSSKIATKLKRVYNREVVVINPGVDVTVFHPDNPMRSKEEVGFEKCPIIFYPGRIWPYKGHDLFILAMKHVASKIRNARAILLGDVNDQRLFRKLVKLRNRLGLEQNVIFLTGITPNVIKYYDAADVVAYPPIDEDFGLVPLEANAMEKPVVLWDDCGCVEDGAIINGFNGMVASAYNTKAFADAIITFLENDELSKKLGENGRQHVSEKFTWNNHVEKLEKILMPTSQAKH